LTVRLPEKTPARRRRYEKLTNRGGIMVCVLPFSAMVTDAG
jgi:hypothetical protein